MNYTEITIHSDDAVLKDLLIAELSVIGFDGFEETDDSLKAFSSENTFDETAFVSLIGGHSLTYTQTSLPQQNWNEVWESNFSPMAVDDFVGVRAAFHEPIANVKHEIIITPKMSFGTGHHATTYMMMELMRDMDFKNKTVLDFGSGTGILAILAEKLGSKAIEAIDYDDWCIENSIENISSNGCKFIQVSKADNAITGKQFDVVLANINKNIILANIEALTEDAAPNGEILLSGLLQEDEKDILEATAFKGWRHLKTITKNNWIAIKFLMPA
jgi:ribosomal protein L11 methyltransferase